MNQYDPLACFKVSDLHPRRDVPTLQRKAAAEVQKRDAVTGSNKHFGTFLWEEKKMQAQENVKILNLFCSGLAQVTLI